MDREQLRGSLDLIILSRIIKQDNYGGGIIREVSEATNQLITIGEGTLYSLLKRLEKKGYVKSYWGDQHLGGRRKYYAITEQGSDLFYQKLAGWRAINTLIESGLEVK
ncbi:transcriptional regulator, PadR family [Amphibacillus marinus]|uniref:Transcriptional regulator, PadR family n=1 Tax=Amphibacillus marinus TaxID=872970 RepID=A0A1H8JVM8_9BACI|nr:PadR family transcriptional regulator [Amphibacillus marinus]SEN84651.1 transcriptional regulator, PadR family [Amphibacillus marinus]